MTDLVRCGLTFDSAVEFRTGFVSRGDGRCFVPWPDELNEGQAIAIDVTVGTNARLEVSGAVLQPDFDESGNIGVVVQLDAPSTAAVATFLEKLQEGSTEPIELFATRVRARTGQTGRLDPSAALTSPELGPAGEAALLEPGTMVDDRFAIEAHLASGGMGDVYRANHVHLKRPVALKLMRRTFASDPEMWARFKREAELVSQLESPHVVRVFDFGQTRDGQPYLAMEYVEGSTLDALLEKGPLSPGHASRVLLQVCEGLAEAHSLGVIHRDLKPANIMLGHKRDGTEVAKILDFGIARLADGAGQGKAADRLTQLGIVVGTPAYLSPEQALADEVDQRTDVYALGCVAYELVTGRPPFLADDLRKVISLHLTAAPAHPATLRPELKGHEALCAVVLKALAKEKERRFQSMQELIAALTDALGGVLPAPSAPPRVPAVEDWSEAPPPAEAPMSPDDWPPPLTTSALQPLPMASTASAVMADDFFATVGGQPLTVPSGSPSGLRATAEALQGLLDDAVLKRLKDSREKLPPTPTQGVVAFLEIFGPPAGSPLARLCLARALTAASEAGAFLDGADEDGALVGFTRAGGLPGGRALKALVAMREAVADAGASAEPPASSSLRAAAIATPLDPEEVPLSGQARKRAQQLAARFKAGELGCDAAVAAGANGAVEVSASSADVLRVSGRHSLTRTPAQELVGRASILETLERRLTSFSQGVVAPALLRAEAGAGRTTLAQELAGRVRQKSLVAAVAHSPEGPAGPAFGALAAMLRATCGVAQESRGPLLRKALVDLNVAEDDVEAALVLAGAAQLPQPLTAGQAVAALRAVLHAGAAGRPTVLIFDGLDEMDEQSVEAFRELTAHPASRELTLGLGDAAIAERCGQVPVLEMPALTAAELEKLVASATQGPPGPALLATLSERAQGMPGAALDWLWWLDERGSLVRAGNLVELADTVPELSPGRLVESRLGSLPLDARRLLEAAALVGETFDGPQLSVAFPRANSVALHAIVASRLIRSAGKRRWRFSSPMVRQAVLAQVSPERPAMHRRLAAGLIDQGKAEPGSVEPSAVARHLSRGGDGARAAQLFKHAADAALQARVPRDAVLALRGLAQALALLPASPEATRARVDALARAASIALSVQDAATARAVVDDAVALERALPAPSPELALSVARVHRSEARRAKAAEALARAAELAQGTPLAALVEVEWAESREQEGDLDEAAQHFEKALSLAEQARELAQWHGEVDLPARLLARLAAVKLQRKDVETAQRLLEQSLVRWKATGWAPGEARVLANLGTALAAAKRFDAAAQSFEAAASAAARCGDLLFRAKALLQQAKALKRHDASSSEAKVVAAEARRLSLALGWEQGRAEAAAL